MAVAEEEEFEVVEPRLIAARFRGWRERTLVGDPELAGRVCGDVGSYDAIGDGEEVAAAGREGFRDGVGVVLGLEGDGYAAVGGHIC